MKRLFTTGLIAATALGLAACSERAQNETAEAGNAIAADTAATTSNAAGDVDAAVHHYSPGSGTPFGDKLDELRALAGGAKLSIDVLPVCAQGGDKRSAMPEKACADLLGRLELRMAQLSGHV